VDISDDLAQEIYDRLVRALSEEEVNRNRAREQRNVPAERYHQKQLLRIERSLQALIEQMEEQKVPPAVNSSRRVLRTPLLKGPLPPSGPF
jgi:ferric-dicitrate binding protein FerR (iron transport regulator)